jgi:hypothetical protein
MNEFIEWQAHLSWSHAIILVAMMAAGVYAIVLLVQAFVATILK